MRKYDNFFQFLGMGLSTTTACGSAYLGTLSVDTFSEQVSSGGLGEYGEATSSVGNKATEAADGNYFALTTVGGLLSLFSGSSTAGPDVVIHVFTENAKPYAKIEKRAKQDYDRYDKNHVKALEEGASLISPNSDVANVLNDIIANCSSKQELLLNLEAIENMLTNEQALQEKQEVKVKKIKYDKNK